MTGLDVGPNELVATAGADGARHHDHQPPERRPRLLRPADPAVGLPADGAPDAQCNQPADLPLRVQVLDRRRGSTTYDPANPPADVATTTTQTGETVPFIVRIETGYQDRDQYQIATLFQPGQPWEPWAPQPQFNHKLLITHGASCGIDHQSGTAPRTGAPCSATADDALGLGFAVMSHRAQQHRPQLQHRHSGRVDGHGQGAARRAVRRDPLHDRHRLLGRLAHPAAGRQRLPRPLPGHPAGLLVPRRVVDRPAARRPTT